LTGYMAFEIARNVATERLRLSVAPGGDMATVNMGKREIRAKLVYYGPGMSGKTTNLVGLHTGYATSHKGRLIKLDTDQERTLFFDYFPAHLGTIGGFRVAVDYFTVPGQSYYNATRRTVLAGADGVVFVADSDPRREEANLVAHQNFVDNLERVGLSLGTVAVVYQWNKRDTERAIPVRRLRAQLNPQGAPDVEASALHGVGIRETERLLLTETLKRVRHQLEGTGARA